MILLRSYCFVLPVELFSLVQRQTVECLIEQDHKVMIPNASLFST